jgi:hypothetical protein
MHCLCVERRNKGIGHIFLKIYSTTGLAGGMFAYPKSQFGHILQGLEMDNVGICILRPRFTRIQLDYFFEDC